MKMTLSKIFITKKERETIYKAIKLIKKIKKVASDNSLAFRKPYAELDDIVTNCTEASNRLSAIMTSKNIEVEDI